MAVRIGFSTNVFDNPADILASVTQISQDFQCIELELGDAAERTVYDASPETYANLVREMRQIIEKRNLRLSIHAPYIGLTGNLSAVDEDKRRASIDRLKKAIIFASDIGSRLVTCHPGLRLRQNQEILLSQLHKSLLEVVPFAQRHGVQLCVENMGNERPNYIVMNVDEQIRMCKETGVKITLDVIHLVSLLGYDQNLERDLERLAPHVANVHIADMNIPSHVHIPIGQGDLPIDKCLRILAKNGFDGAAIVEEFGGPFEIDLFYQRARTFRHFFEEAQS